MADDLAKVTDAESAKAIAPTAAPLIDRQSKLLKRLSGLRIEMSEEEYAPYKAKYGEQAQRAGQRALAEQARIFGNHEILVVFGRSALSSVSPEDLEKHRAAVEAENADLGDALSAQTSTVNKISDLLASVHDQETARQAQPTLRQLIPEYEQVARRATGRLVAASGNLQRQEMHQSMMAAERMNGEIKRIAKTPARDVLRQDLIDLVSSNIRIMPNERLRAKVQQQIGTLLKELGLEP